MPEQRGRKRRRDRRDRETPGGDASVTTTPAPATASAPASSASAATRAPAGSLPSRNARLSGLALALVTFILSGMIFVGAFDEDLSDVEMIGRMILGGAMLLLALFVGVLVVFPAQIRDYFARRRASE